ncbi:MAG TPA: antibiotic biosynthesis monooxygenase [Streptosporangiaceae bacterium]|nr:antibiotic biosynthesis monooxygenase [Streptosporangiaceae bacterium]
MSLPVLIGFAGVVVAAVATGMLAGRCARRPRIDFIAWTAATFGLTVALAAQSIGFASGFGSVTFRTVQLFALLLAPLWLAWGLVELVAGTGAARFAMRLAVGALTILGGVVLLTDPLTAQPFTKSWPVAGLHYQPPSHYGLDLVQLVAVIAALASVSVAAVRARNDRPWFATLTGIAPVGVAVLLTLALRFSLPARSAYPLLAMVAAGLVWFGVTRIQDPPSRSGRAGHSGGFSRSARFGRPDRTRERYAAADGYEADGYAADGYAAADGYEADGYAAADGYEAGGRGRRRDPREPRGSRQPWYPDGSEPAGLDPDRRPLAPWQTQEAQPLVAAGAPATLSGAAGGLGGADGEFGQPAKPAGSPAGKPARPYGRILIFTLLEDRVADFDRLAEQTAEEVRTGEPDTLVYVIHLVPNAPMQRIFYEIYRDHAAFDAHESQPYMQRFVAERRSCVLATNVIELRLKYAKVAPLPYSQPEGPQTPPGALGQLPPRQPAALPPVPPGPPQAWPQGQVQTLEPLPPGPDRRRLPSAGRRHGGT